MTNRSLETQDDMKSKLFNFVNLNVHLQRRLKKFVARQVLPKPGCSKILFVNCHPEHSEGLFVNE